MLRRNSVIVLTFVLLASSLVSHRVRAEMSGGSVSGESGSATQTQAVLRYLDIGTAHSCGLLDNNTIKCWGLGSSGQLGYGATSTLGDGAGEMGDALATIDLGTGRTAKQIATGSSHSCAVLDNNTVKCWGLGTNGRLGYEATATLGDGAGEMGDALSAVDLGTGRTAVAISAGSARKIAIAAASAGLSTKASSAAPTGWSLMKARAGPSARTRRFKVSVSPSPAPTPCAASSAQTG
jgi:hypothetical protein